jgi:hypothetical protein
MSDSGTDSEHSAAAPVSAVKTKRKLPPRGCTPEQRERLAGLRLKALEKRQELKALRDKEKEARRLRDIAELKRRKMAADCDLDQVSRELADLAEAKALKDDPPPPAPAVPVPPVPQQPKRRIARNGDSDSDDLETPKLREQVHRLTVQVAKLRTRVKYGSQPQQQQQPQQPQPAAKSELSQAASDALQQQLHYSISGFGKPRLF